jgi:hypothetical protein
MDTSLPIQENEFICRVGNKNEAPPCGRGFIMVLAIEEVCCLVWQSKCYLLAKHVLNVDKFFKPPNETENIFFE